MKNIEVRSEDSANLDEKIGIDEFSEDVSYYLHPDVKNSEVLWHNIAGSHADWCRGNNGKVLYKVDVLTIKVQICENIGTKLQIIEEYISLHRKEVKSLKKIPAQIKEITSLLAPVVGKAKCKLDTNTFEGFSQSYSCDFKLLNDRAKSIILGEGRFESEKMLVLSLNIDYALKGSRHTSVGNNLMNSVLVLDEVDSIFRTGYSFFNFNYRLK